VINCLGYTAMKKKLYQPRWQNVRALSIYVAAIIVVIVGQQSFAGADNPIRYPYDPACPWGRIADGNGMLVRCLASGEASQLMGTQEPTRTKTEPTAGAPSTGDAFVPVEPIGAAAVPKGAVRVDSVGPAVADAGELPLADKKLSVAKDRFVECANKNGGLSAKQAKVVVRFLVRERGRAEGVGVKSFSGVSQAAAECIADVVNLRYVGYPAAPIVGATIPIVLSVAP
jgi:hypothetical protein